MFNNFDVPEFEFQDVGCPSRNNGQTMLRYLSVTNGRYENAFAEMICGILRFIGWREHMCDAFHDPNYFSKGQFYSRYFIFETNNGSEWKVIPVRTSTSTSTEGS